MRLGLLAFAVTLFSAPLVRAQTDTDHDGLSDALESALLEQFAPTFLVSQTDCSMRPARFTPGLAAPRPLADDGTIYGQAFHPAGRPALIELHFFHLWRRDCGEAGHTLDTEHVAALLEPGAKAGEWQATDWYAAAHEDTLCDASQLTRASTLDAVSHGPRVWISAGKHASFLAEELCHHGCGGDRCEQMTALAPPAVINLGELGAPMNGSSWLSSAAWPLATKLGRSDFPAARLARLDLLPATDIAWANPEKRPEQAVIAGANATYGSTAAGAAAGLSGAETGASAGLQGASTGLNGAATGLSGAATGANAGLSGAGAGVRATDTALVVTGSSLARARDRTGHALGRAFGSVGHALKKSADAVTPGAGTDDAEPAKP